MKIINFISNRPWLTKESKSKPVPTSKSIPQWYKNADRFAKMPTGEHYQATKEMCPFPKKGTTDDYGKIPTWKACPALLDVLTTGYTLITPCDIEFFLDSAGQIDFKIEDPMYKEFVNKRPPMPQFYHPKGYYEYHFAWWPEWAVKVPAGYSVLYVSPFNRYDIPIMTVSGIIDNDEVNLPGLMPFFVQEGWAGVLPAGTPYAQLLPFLREDWKSEINIPKEVEMIQNNMENSKKYRIADGGVYQKEVWTRRLYE
jgi:hypothetical protein